MVRPIKYLLIRDYEDTPPKQLPKLPLHAISGIVEDDIPLFKDLGIKTIPDLANAKYGELKGKKMSDYKLNHGISYAIDMMIQAEEPGVHDEIMPIDELLDKKYEATPADKLADLDTVAVEGIAPANSEKLKKIKISTIKELADADIATIKSAGLKDWEAEKFSQYAKWIMEYAKTNIKKPKMENIEFKLKDNLIILKIDISKEFGKSSSGKSIIIANSHGNHRIKGTELILGAFAYKYPDKNKIKSRKVKEAQNVDINLDGNIATITMKTTEEYGPSASGKSIIIASTRGNKLIVDSEVYLGINLYKSKKK
ncbi:MAG: hypothetical protein ACTSPY_16010 [Candidatus Helarchaeota archaeon]